MSSSLLLDTCAIIWLSQDQPIADHASQQINSLKNTNGELLVSPISAWELGLLTTRNRLVLPMDTKKWFEWYMMNGQVKLAELSPDTLIDSSCLPGTPPNDPADRIIIATARSLNLTIVTRDRKILDYADCGHVRSLKC